MKHLSTYQPSKFWHGVGKAGLWRLFGNTVSLPVNLRYVKYGRYCQQHSKDVPPTSAEKWPFRSEEPVTVRSALNPDTAASMVQLISDAIGSGTVQPSAEMPFFYSIPEPLKFFGESILDIFDGPLGAALQTVLGSHFRIEWLDCYRTIPGESKKSWLWHIDNDPPFVIKVLLYLNDSTMENGATRILSTKDTKTSFEHGYFGVYDSERTSELLSTDWAKAGQIKEQIPERKAGDAMIFSTNNLHRGGTVRSGFRDVMSFLLVPSPIPWRTAYQRTGQNYVHLASGFPSDPMQFLKA
jgi:hypothetical protein